MRLIDAVLLKKQFKNAEVAYLSIEEICKWIDEAPTERKIGHWIPNGKNGSGIINPGRHCSVCKKQVEFSENYCPRCGSGWETERPQGEWFDCIETGILKARHGDYVLYKVDFLLDNLSREVYIMEGARRMRGKEE